MGKESMNIAVHFASVARTFQLFLIFFLFLQRLLRFVQFLDQFLYSRT